MANEAESIQEAKERQGAFGKRGGPLRCAGLYVHTPPEQQERMHADALLFFEVFGDEGRVRTVVCDMHIGDELGGMARDGHYMCEARALTNFDGSLTDAGADAGVEV